MSVADEKNAVGNITPHVYLIEHAFSRELNVTDFRVLYSLNALSVAYHTFKTLTFYF